MVNTTPTGTMMPTMPALRAGTNTKRTSMRRTGAIASFQFLEIRATPSAPKSAGSIWSKAGLSTGLSSTGLRGTMRSTPMAIIIIVTIEETAIAMVEMISPSSLLESTPAFSSALIAQGSFRLEILPVTKER